jgi:hypothetical protein
VQPTRRPGTPSERRFLTRRAHFWLSGALGAEATESGERRFWRNPKAPDRHQRHRSRRSGSPESACARRHRGQLRLTRTPQCRGPILLESWNLRSWLSQPRSSSNLPRERCGLWKDLRCLPPPRSLPGSYSRVTVARLPPESDSRDDRAFFTNPELTTLTGSGPLGPRRLSPVGRLATGS